MRILVIEDDLEVSGFITKGLMEHGHVVDQVHDGKDGLIQATTQRYDLLIVDRMLPGVNGTKIVMTLRATNDKTPIIFLSALAEVDQKVEGLRSGADDYLTKPFAFTELLARAEVLHRRNADVIDNTKTYELMDLILDLRTRTVTRAGEIVRLQNKEFQLLAYLLEHQDQVVTRTMLLEQVWDFHFDPQTNLVDVHISRLRQKIDRGRESPLLHTIRGAGYMLSSKPQS